MKSRFYFTQAKLAFIVFTPPVLLLLPADFFDNRKSICLSKLLFNFECYACGLTRGIMHLIHLEFEEAFAYNMLSFIVLPLLIVIWIQWFFKEWNIYKKMRVVMNSKVSS
jgi:hypothetical protein